MIRRNKKLAKMRELRRKEQRLKKMKIRKNRIVKINKNKHQVL